MTIVTIRTFRTPVRPLFRSKYTQPLALPGGQIRTKGIKGAGGAKRTFETNGWKTDK
jgi:hypothetical protein